MNGDNISSVFRQMPVQLTGTLASHSGKYEVGTRALIGGLLHPVQR